MAHFFALLFSFSSCLLPTTIRTYFLKPNLHYRVSVSSMPYSVPLTNLSLPLPPSPSPSFSLSPFTPPPLAPATSPAMPTRSGAQARCETGQARDQLLVPVLWAGEEEGRGRKRRGRGCHSLEHVNTTTDTNPLHIECFYTWTFKDADTRMHARTHLSRVLLRLRARSQVWASTNAGC